MAEDYMQKKFEDWFYEIEGGYSFRSERMIENLYHAAEIKDINTMISLIKAAFEQGYIAGKEENKND